MGKVDNRYHLYKSQKYSNSAGPSSLPAHKNSTASIEGPGMFKYRIASNTLDADSNDNKQEPLDRFNFDPVDLDSKSSCKKNSPPTAKVESFVVIKKLSEFLLVDVKCKILADENGASDVEEGKTICSPIPGWQSPAYSYQGGKIIKFEGKFEWKGVIEIQTKYGPGVNPSGYSCYGRGTTKEDIESGNVTLGFHESCHRDDYISFFKNKSDLPMLPDLKIGMKVSKFISEINKFKSAYNKYDTKLSKCSVKTDECGFTKKKHKSTGKCFNHAFCAPSGINGGKIDDHDLEGF